MALSPEKNDVDISALFNYRKPVILKTNNEEELTVYMRIIGDAELQRARVKALRASRELRDNLRDKNSDEYLAYIPDVSEIEKERLVEMLLISDLREISKEVAEDVDVPFPEELDEGASLEEQEQYQLEVDEYPKKRETIIKKEIISRANKRKEEHLEKPVKELKKLYISGIEQELCEKRLMETFYDYVIFYSLYKDKNYSIKLFSSFEDYINLPSDIKEELLQEYKLLELGIEELKK